MVEFQPRTPRAPINGPLFRTRGQTKGRAGGLIERETFRCELVPSEQSVHQLSRLTVSLKTRAVGAALVGEHDQLGSTTDLAIIPELRCSPRNRAANHSHPQTLRPARFPGGRVEQIPDLEATGIAPLDPHPVDGIVPVCALR